MPFNDELDELAEREPERTYPGEDQDDREQPAPGTHRVDLGESHRADRDDRHVQRVEYRPALDEQVAQRADEDHAGNQPAGPRQAPPHRRTSSSRRVPMNGRLR